MKPFSRFFTDLGLFLVFFGLTGAILYTGVYSEETIYPDGGKVLISEVRPSGGTGKSNDEFVEIYNPSTQPIIIGGWGVYRMTKNASSTDRQLVFTFPIGTILVSHGHVLVAHSDFVGEITPDFRYIGQALADDNTVVLVDSAGQVIDLVGYGLAKNTEIAPAEAPSGQLFSIERRSGGILGNQQDTNNNQADFFRVSSNPQNLLSEPTPVLVVSNNESEVTSSTEEEVLLVPEEIPEEVPQEPEVTQPEVILTTTTLENITPTSSVSVMEITTTSIDLPHPTSTISITNNPVPTSASTTTAVPKYLPGDILINELYPIPESGQSEFVELFNISNETIDLVGWYLTEGSNTKTLLTGVLGSKNYLVIEKPRGSLNNSGDMVSLYAPNNIVIDRVAYGDWNDGDTSNNAEVAKSGMSLGRVQENKDTGFDKIDFGLSTAVSKGSANTHSPVVSKEDVLEVEDQPVITVIGNLNNSTTTSKPGVVKAGPLYPRIVYSAKGRVGTGLVFDASQSSGGQGGRKYVWEMDDGTILHGEIITHIFTEPGNYSVSLTLTDDTGTEKHKTIKVEVQESEIKEKILQETKKQTATAKTAAAKKIDEVVFVGLSEIGTLKTNTQIRTRGILAGILATKTNPEFYLVAESSAGGSAVGILIKTKSTTLDARIGDVVEITGKYIVGSTGNYVQFSNTDQLSIVGNGEIMTPVSSTVKEVRQLIGGYVQASGEVIEKKTNYIFIGDNTGEIKVSNVSSDSLKMGDRVIVTGYIIKTKDGSEIKLAGPEGIQMKKVIITPESIEERGPPARPINVFVILGIIFAGLVGWGVKKFWFNRKTEINSATET